MEVPIDDFRTLPYDIGTADFIKTYPKIATIPEFRERSGLKNFNALFVYIVLLYSPNTPLLQIPDDSERREYARNFSKVKQEDLDQSSGYIIGYLRHMHSDKWAKLCVYRDAFYNQALRLQSDDTKSGERTAALIDNIEKLETRIEATLMAIAKSDKEIRASIIDHIEEERLQDLRPESRVAKALSGEPPLDYDIYQSGKPKKVRTGRKIHNHQRG